MKEEEIALLGKAITGLEEVVYHLRSLLGNVASPRALRDTGKMIRIPGGTVTLGEDGGSNPRHTVTLAPYEIGETEVTNAEFACFVEATGYNAGTEWKKYASENGPYAPVVCVSWHDASAYCEWVGGRLPTSDEWEYAARGDDGRIYPWGNEWDPSRCSNSVENLQDKPAPVGSFPSGASPFGCLDMAGNVWEWTASKW